MARIGLVAGEGRLPIVFARMAKDKGDTVIAIGVKGMTDPSLERYVHKLHWLEWGNWKKGLLLCVSERIGNIIMLGKLKKDKFFKDRDQLDDEAKRILDKLGDKKDSSIFNEASKYLSKIGVKIIDSTTYMNSLIPRKGTLTKREPVKSEWADIEYGRTIAMELSRFDIGQTLAIKDKTVIALEAVEGTDETISRAGRLTDSGFVAVKMARPDQDMRFDVPLVGPETLQRLIEAGGTALAMESDKTLLMDKDEVISLADRNNISIVII